MTPMAHNPFITTPEAERAELENAIEALRRWPRLASILRYLGEKYFAGEVDQLHEYNIATEVLGRSKLTFNSAEDAIARVETHRLRRRLREFYDAEGKDHLLQVTIPSGGYVPQFIERKREEQTSVASIEMDGALAATSFTPPVVAPFSERLRLAEPSAAGLQAEAQVQRRWLGAPFSRRLLFLVAAVAMLVLAAYLTSLYIAGTRSDSGQDKASVSSRGVVPAAGFASVPLRILAGYSGNPRIDSSGATWEADKYYDGGGSWRRSPSPVSRTNAPFLFDQARTGDFEYRIPLQPGVYELHLFFVTSLNASETISTFSVSINDELVLRGFDVNSDALGDGIADERVFRDVSPAKDGYLHLRFAGEIGPPSLNAIEILPGQPHKLNPIRLTMQTAPLTDRKGQLWRPDNYFMNGRMSQQPRAVSNTPDPELFTLERYGHFTYAIPVDSRGKYTVVLHFSELYFGPQASGFGGVGSRIFRVICNGETLLDDFDLYKEAGSFHLVTKTFHHLRPNAQGKLNLTFEPISNNATVSGIEVLDESQ